jgi:hypothetical protein
MIESWAIARSKSVATSSGCSHEKYQLQKRFAHVQNIELTICDSQSKEVFFFIVVTPREDPG